MFKRLLLFASVVLMIALVSCKGDKGDVGPAGAQGPVGPAGPAGPAGEDGASSSALIISTGKVDTDTTGGYITGIENLDADEDSLLSSAAILVYLKAQGVYWPMPGLISFGGGKVSSFTFVHAVQDKTFFVELIPTDWNENQTKAPMRTFEDIRVVIVPGQIANKRLSAEVLKDYNKTIATLGLKNVQVKMAGKLKLKGK